MRKLLWLILLIPAISFSQQQDTTFLEYIKYADAANNSDGTGLKAYRLYIAAVILARDHGVPDEQKPQLAYLHEQVGKMSYDFNLFDYAIIYYESSLRYYRELEDVESISRVIPKIALCYKAMREQNKPLLPPQADEFETSEVYYRILSEPEYRNGKVYAEINGGMTDGIYPSSIGYAYGVNIPSLPGRGALKIGDAVIQKLDTNTTIVEISATGIHDSMHTIYKGDMVQMLSLIPKTEYRSKIWALAINQIVFLNELGEPIYDYRMLLKYDSEILQNEILEIMRRDIHSTWAWLRDLSEEDKAGFSNLLEDRATRGRYKGFTVYEAMAKTSTDDILAFLGFVQSYPGKYMGIPYKINETYATWLLNECYIGFDEFLAMILKAESDADYEKLVSEYYDEITEDEFFIRLNMYAEDFAEDKDIESARAVNARVIRLSQFIEDQSYKGWAYFNKGRIYDYVDNTDTSIFYYEKAIPFFEATNDQKGIAFCQNNLASIYEDFGDYQKANEYYRLAFAAKRNLRNDTNTDASNNFYSMAKSNSGMGNTEYLLANYDSALAAYERGIAYSDSAESLEGKEYAVALITDMARVYKKRGQYALASGLYKDQVKRYAQLGKPAKVADALDHVADVLFSQGEYQKSLNKYLEAKAIKVSLEDYSGAGFSLSNCGQAMWNLGNLDSAISFHRKAIEYRQKDNDTKGVAFAYSKMGALYKALGYANQAADYYGQSIATYYDFGDSLKVAELSIDLGDLYESLKNYTAALEYYDKALNIYEARSMKSDAAYVRSYKGYVYYLLKDFNQAETLYRNALALRKEINERQSIMYSLVDLSTIMLYAKFDLDTALILLDEAMDLAKETESIEYQAYCHETIGHAYYFRAQTSKAADHYEAALQLYTDNGNISGQCNMLLNLGASELQRGAFGKALALYNQSLEIARKGELNLQVANTYNYLAEYYYYTGEFAKAFDVIDSSYALFAEAGNAYGIANTHIVDGNTNNLIGNASVAFKQYELADSIYIHLKDPLSRATAINNMGTITFFRGDYNEALRLFARCRSILDSVNVKSALLSTVTGNIGEVYMEKGIWDESKRWFDEAIEIATEMGATRDVWGHKTLYAKLLYKQGKYNESLAILEETIKVFRKSDEKMAIAEIATTMGKSQRALGNFEKARNYFDEAIAIYKDIGSKKLIWDPLYNLALVEKADNNTLVSVELLKEAVDTLEHLSSDVVGDGANKKLFAKADDKKNIYQELITQLVSSGEAKTAWLYQEKLNVYGLTEQTRGEPTRGVSDANNEEIKLEELQLQADGIYAQLMKEKAKPADQRSEDKIKALESRMSIASEKYQNFFWDLIDNGIIENDFSNTINPEELDQLRYDLDEDIVILEYLATDHQLIIFVASFDTLGAKVIDISEENLETYINGYYGLLINQADFEPLDKAAYQLYQVLIEPVKRMIQDKKKLAFIPTGNMFKLPFQSLGTPIKDGMHYLIEDYDVFYLNDIRSTMRQSGFDPNTAKLIAFGNADSTLIHAEEEVNMILETFPTADVYIKKQAKEDVAKTSMNDYQIVHFATHGNLDPINFSNSYLTMAPNLDAGEDGKLTMREINRMRTLRGCQLIVLSACNTAVNDEKLNGWINNPAKAFLRKGAKTAVASLWSVDDAATGRMMQNFYKNMKAGQTKAEALNNAQRELVTSSFFGHPYYWAAFELIGQWE